MIDDDDDLIVALIPCTALESYTSWSLCEEQRALKLSQFMMRSSDLDCYMYVTVEGYTQYRSWDPDPFNPGC